MAGIGAPELVILLALFATGVVPILALVDAARQPPGTWRTTGYSQTLWIALNAVGIVACGLGLVVGIVYFAVVRPRLVGATAEPGPPP